jgi:hypothetical protein
MKYDSAGVLHMAIAVSGYGTADGLYALDWNGTSWSQPVRISQGADGKKSIEIPALVVSSGNRVNVAFEEDFHRIWYTSQAADAPLLASRAVPTPPVSLAPTSSVLKPVPVSDLPGLVVRPTPTPRTTAASQEAQPASTPIETTSGPLLPLLTAFLSGLVLFGVIAIVRARALE